MDDEQPDPAFAEAHAALTQARQALDAASSAIVDAERRHGLDRRVRIRGGRRAVDIERLDDMDPAAFVTVGQLAEYWRPCHPNSVLYYISTGKLKAAKVKREYRIRVADALAFEPWLYRKP